MNYYNEFDPKAAQWLRELIKAGLIPAGDVDERSIEDVVPTELHGYHQCHFFAGVGGWSKALQLAGFTGQCWTGSCPCQPFSSAGAGAGFADERHLWPAFFHLIQQSRPAVVFGEQVASPAALRWLDLVFDDLEGSHYACAAADLCAPGVGAPHIRQRLFWVADGRHEQSRWPAKPGKTEAGRAFGDATGCRDVDGLEHANSSSADGRSPSGQQSLRDACGQSEQDHGWTGPLDGFWRAADWLRCRDDKWRPVESGTFPLAHGVPRELVRVSDPGAPIHPSEARTMRIRGYGNAIVPGLAAEFIKAVMR